MRTLLGIGRRVPKSRRPTNATSASILEHLQRVDVLSGISREEMAPLLSGMQPLECPAGTLLFSPEDPSERLFILKIGHVDVYRLTPEGKRLVIRRFGPGTIFGEMRMLGRTLEGGFAETADPVLVCIVTREHLNEVLQRRPDVAIRMLEVVGSQVVDLEERLEQALFSPVKVRLASFLLTKMDPSTLVVTEYTHEEIGDTIGALRQTVTETLSSMRDQGLVQVERKQIRVIDRAKLAQIARLVSGSLPGEGNSPGIGEVSS